MGPEFFDWQVVFEGDARARSRQLLREFKKRVYSSTFEIGGGCPVKINGKYVHQICSSGEDNSVKFDHTNVVFVAIAAF